MDNYVEKNKRAWETSFEHRTKEFDSHTETGLKTNPEGFFSDPLRATLQRLAIPHARLAQLCANNGRETIAALALGYEEAVGFDIAQNMVDYANALAADLGKHASFVAGDILTIQEPAWGTFDVVLTTVGALTWFEDLRAFFRTAAHLLKPGGTLVVEDMHPFVNMLACKNETPYQADMPSRPVYDYFVKRPWEGADAMTYMTEDAYETEDFTSFAHTVGDIVNGVAGNGLILGSFREFPTDRSDSFLHLDHSGLPLTYLLEAKKP